MTIGALMLRKPSSEDVGSFIVSIGQHNDMKADSFSYSVVLMDKMFWHAWLFMFLNISAGLALIGCSASIFKDASIRQDIIVTLMLLAGIFNGGFRLIFAWASDFLKNRIDIWLVISILSVIFLTIAGCNYSMVGIAVLLINACYGGGFSSLPAVLSDCYDMNNLSRMHGLTLSAWAFAGLAGNNLSILVFDVTGSFHRLILILVIVYSLNAVNVYFARSLHIKRMCSLAK